MTTPKAQSVETDQNETPLALIEPSHFLISAATKLRRDGGRFQDANQRCLNHWKATDSYSQDIEANTIDRTGDDSRVSA